MSRTTIHVLNASEHSKTLAGLKRAAAQAKGKAKATITELMESLKANPTSTARGRRTKKEAHTMATKKRTATKRRRTTHKAKRRTNPTFGAATTTHRRRRVNPTRSGGSGAARGFNVMGIAVRGATIAGGMLAQSFGARQAARFLPSLPGIAHQAIGSAAVVAGAVFLGKGAGWAQDLAASAIAAGIQGIAVEMMPGVFAGIPEEQAYVAGYEDGSMQGVPYDDGTGMGAYDDGVNGLDDGMGGIAYDLTGPVPQSKFRPAGF